MPTVPRYRPESVQEQGLRLPQSNVNTSAETYGGGQVAERVGQASSGLSQTAFKIAEQQKKFADDVVATDSAADLSKWETDLLYNQKTGLLNRKGKEAFGTPEDAEKAYQSKIEETEKGLSNQDQVATFRKLAASHKADVDRQLTRHVGTESVRVDEEATTAFLANEKDAAIMNYHDPERIQKAIGSQAVILQGFATRNGHPPEWLQQKTSEAVSKTHAGVIDRMVNNGDDLAAEAYYRQNKKQIGGADASQLEKVLELGSLRGASQRFTDKILAENLPETEALKRAKTLEPKLRDAVETRLSQQYALRTKAEAADREKVVQKIGSDLSRTKGQAEIPETEQVKLSIEDNTKLMQYKDRLLKGVEVPPNGPRFYRLSLQAKNPDTRAQFANEVLTTYAHEMTDAELTKLIELQGNIREKDENTTALLDALDQNEKIKRDTLSKVGVNPDNTSWFGSADEKGYLEFNKAIDLAVEQKEAAVKRKILPEEMQEIANRFAVRVATSKGGLFSDKKYVGTVKPGDLGAEDIPTPIRQELEFGLKAKGWPVTPENLLKFYVKGLRDGRYKPDASR